MYRLIISIESDDEALQRAALKAAVEAVEDVNNAPVYRAYLETIKDGKIVGVPNGYADDPAVATDVLDRTPAISKPLTFDYQVTFRRGLLGWAWEAKRPDGTTFGPVLEFNMYATKDKAEAAAARAIARDGSAYTISGKTLRNRAGS